MADQSDVEQALVDSIAATIYPNGISAGPIATVGNTLVDVRRGWPLPTTLDIALANGNDVLVRVYPESGMTRNTSRFTLEWRELPRVDPTLTATVSGSTVTFAGAGDPGYAVGVMVGAPPHGTPYAYRLLPGDGPVQVALALQAMVGGSTGASNGVLTLVTNLPVLARVATDRTAFLETRRQDQGFRISIWSANNVARDAVARAIDESLANLLDVNGNPTMNLILADNTAGWVRYRSTYNLDNAEKAGLYRRDLCYMIEYPTGVTSAFPEVLFPTERVTFDAATSPAVILTS